MLYIGTAGWSIPRPLGHRFEGPGSHLARYARVLRGAEINSTFKKVHRPGTFARWAASTPEDFRFAVKMPAAITQVQRLVDASEAVAAFVGDIEPLGTRLGVVLVQLPGSFAFDEVRVRHFFDDLRQRYEGPVACEPRHPSWFEADAERSMADFRVARVAADPARVPAAALPGGWRGDGSAGLAYFRWHGSPRMYRSAYLPERLAGFAQQAAHASAQGDCWCVFDNTAEGAAAADALSLSELLAAPTSAG